MVPICFNDSEATITACWYVFFVYSLLSLVFFVDIFFINFMYWYLESFYVFTTTRCMHALKSSNVNNISIVPLHYYVCHNGVDYTVHSDGNVHNVVGGESKSRCSK